jgi:hypothetical protein
MLQNSSLAAVRKPANLKLQLQEYSSALFNAEARHYAKHARSDEEMRAWLSDLAMRTENEVILEIQKHSSAHDFHCPASERKTAIADGLTQRSEHWIKIAESDHDAIMVRAQWALDRANQINKVEKSIEDYLSRGGTITPDIITSFVKATRLSVEQIRDAVEQPIEAMIPTPRIVAPTFVIPPSNINAETHEEAFPKRAAWLKDRLKERAWDRNDIARCGGPDVKTVKKILDCKFVRVGAFEKLVTALNHHRTAKAVSILDIPSD